MKIGILTLIEYSNYGNRLQHFALSHVLESHFQAEVVNLSTDADVPVHHAKTFFERLSNWWFEFRSGDAWQERVAKLQVFSQRYLGKGSAVQVDVVLVGSNHVWNPFILTMNQFKHFLLADVKADKKVAYAGGTSGKPWSRELINIATHAFNSFDHVSVAGPVTQQQFYAVTGIKAPIVVDPVLLLTADEWTQALTITVENRPEVVTFFRKTQSAEMCEFINRVATAKDLTITANHSLEKRHASDFSKTPAELISDVASATIVFTDSFHVAAIALLYGTPFVVSKPHYKRPEDSQLLRLLIQIGMENRLFSHITEVEEAFDCQFEEAQELLTVQRKKSMEFLREAIGT